MILMIITSIIGIVGVAAAVGGFFIADQSWFERIIFFIGGLLMVIPGVHTDMMGLALLLAGYIIQRRKLSNQRLNANTGA